MSLNRTLRRLFVEVRREARRNPEFAARLDAALRAHGAAGDVGSPALETPLPTLERSTAVAEGAGGSAAMPELNPVALLVRDGEDALTEALIALPDAALQRLLSEHNLDPAGAAEGLAGPNLVAHIVAQAQKRVERDRKLFDY
jgi:hypothetical protein